MDRILIRSVFRIMNWIVTDENLCKSMSKYFEGE